MQMSLPLLPPVLPSTDRADSSPASTQSVPSTQHKQSRSLKQDPSVSSSLSRSHNHRHPIMALPPSLPPSDKPFLSPDTTSTDIVLESAFPHPPTQQFGYSHMSLSGQSFDMSLFPSSISSDILTFSERDKSIPDSGALSSHLTGSPLSPFDISSVQFQHQQSASASFEFSQPSSLSSFSLSDGNIGSFGDPLATYSPLSPSDTLHDLTSLQPILPQQDSFLGSNIGLAQHPHSFISSLALFTPPMPVENTASRESLLSAVDAPSFRPPEKKKIEKTSTHQSPLSSVSEPPTTSPHPSKSSSRKSHSTDSSDVSAHPNKNHPEIPSGFVPHPQSSKQDTPSNELDYVTVPHQPLIAEPPPRVTPQPATPGPRLPAIRLDDNVIYTQMQLFAQKTGTEATMMENLMSIGNTSLSQLLLQLSPEEWARFVQHDPVLVSLQATALSPQYTTTSALPSFLQKRPYFGAKNPPPASVVHCFKCGQPGHSFDQCPLHLSSPQNVGSRIDRTSCYKCGQPGHHSRDCPNEDQRICFHCNQTGHVMRDCPFKKRPLRTDSIPLPEPAGPLPYFSGDALLPNPEASFRLDAPSFVPSGRFK
ncbi:hypothetical protein BLNAU_19095 [Blattamonas nauphoetae]|uniref:CCHC-type domain-containing protein n=1 Tax=Blattamonas nauphoetae TaxID=2049346 RepID=A0ABQ9X2F4_9EUKA|nr:hypothetical protein BLNAU_19095 [Blattamonas nauphoetae]